MISFNLLKNLTDPEKTKIKEKQAADTFSKLFYVSIIFTLIGLIYFIADIVTGFYKNPYGYLDFAAVALLLVSSIIVAVSIRLFKDRAIRYIQIITSIYFLAINSVMLLFLSSDLNAGKQDFLICFFNFVLINFVINYNLILSIATEALVVIASIVIIIAFSAKESMLINTQQAIIILGGTIAAHHYLRTIVTKSFIKELRIEQISKEFELSSTIDFLTKLLNRKGLDMFVNKEIQAAILDNKLVSVSMVDIDDFKSYNDEYSHMAGDQCLRRIGAELNRLAIEKFHAFRYGGEEFLLIGIDVTNSEIEKFNNELLASIRNLRIDRSKVKSVEDYVTVSIGTDIGKIKSTEGLKILLKVADSRLYLSKRNGKDRVTSIDE